MKTTALLQTVLFASILSQIAFADWPQNFAEQTHSNILSNTHNEDELWAEDIRREWKISTEVMSQVAGKNGIVIQCGFLNSTYNTGSLMFVLKNDDRKPKFEVLIRPRWASRVDRIELNLEKFENLDEFAQNLQTWAHKLVNDPKSGFKEGRKIPADVRAVKPGEDGFFVIEISHGESGKTVQYIEPDAYKSKDVNINRLFAWTLHHANAWKKSSIEEMFEIKFTPLPSNGRFHFPE